MKESNSTMCHYKYVNPNTPSLLMLNFVDPHAPVGQLQVISSYTKINLAVCVTTDHLSGLGMQ